MIHAFKAIAASSVAISGVGGIFFYNKLNAESGAVDSSFEDYVSLVQTQSEKIKLISNKNVAVIGGGIGGSSATYFLRQSLGPSATIDVYEKSDRIGGRIDVITLNGETMEAGGTFMLNSNKYMIDFVKETELDINPPPQSRTKMSIFNGSTFAFIDGSSKWLTISKMLWRYGPITMWRMNTLIKESFSTFKNIYTLQNKGDCFSTVQEMLEAMGGKSFYEYTQQSCKQVMKDKGIDDRVIDELVTAMLRWHYGQNADNVNGLTGIYSMTGSQGGGIFNISGGNHQVCQRLLKHSDANVHMKTKVTGIRKNIDKETGKTVYYLEGAGLDSVPYDAVVIAVPLEIQSCFLACHECQHWPDQDTLGNYQKTITSFIQASVNFKKFGFETAKEMPGLVLSTEGAKNFSVISPMSTINGRKPQSPIYKVFSRQLLSKDTMLDLFDFDSEQPPAYNAISWLANPRFTKCEKFLPFELDEGVFYVNAIERVAANMEMSSIGGKNAALLALNYLQK